MRASVRLRGAGGAQRLGQAAAHRMPRVERRIGVLEDHLDRAAQLAIAASREIAPIVGGRQCRRSRSCRSSGSRGRRGSGRASSCRSRTRRRGRRFRPAAISIETPFSACTGWPAAQDEGLDEVAHADERLLRWARDRGRSPASRARRRNARICGSDLAPADAGREPARRDLRRAAACRLGRRRAAQSQRSAKAQRSATSSGRGTEPRIAISRGTRRSAGGSESSRPSV